MVIVGEGNSFAVFGCAEEDACIADMAMLTPTYSEEYQGTEAYRVNEVMLQRRTATDIELGRRLDLTIRNEPG